MIGVLLKKKNNNNNNNNNNKKHPWRVQNLALRACWKFTLTPGRYQKEIPPSIKLKLTKKQNNTKNRVLLKKNPKVSLESNRI